MSTSARDGLRGTVRKDGLASHQKWHQRMHTHSNTHTLLTLMAPHSASHTGHSSSSSVLATKSFNWRHWDVLHSKHATRETMSWGGGTSFVQVKQVWVGTSTKTDWHRAQENNCLAVRNCAWEKRSLKLCAGFLQSPTGLHAGL